jgi:hypothetical protein
MKATRTMLAVFFVMCALALAAPARAQTTVGECKACIDLIQTDLDAIFAAGGIGGNNPTQTYNSLTSKLQGAKTKLDQHKFADALQKLQDFKTAVIALHDAAKPKLSADDAALLLDGNGDSAIDEGVNGAIACVALLP